MKRFFSALTAMILALLLVSAYAEEDKYYTFVLYEITENDITYRAYGNYSITFQMYDSGKMKSYGLREGEEAEDPAVSWKASEDFSVITMTIGGQDYELDFQDNIMTLDCGERKLIFRQKFQAEEAAAEETEYQTLTAGELSEYIGKECPATQDHWTDRVVSYRMDGNAVYRFNTEYGPFRYVVDMVDGEILEKEEADIEAARAQEGFREKLTSEEIYEYVFKVCPVERSAAEKIARQADADGNWDITITTVYGDFFYKVDGYTGEIMDAVEPDVDAIREEKGITDPITSEQALEIAEQACPLDFGQITGRKVSKSDSGFKITLGSEAGDFIYVIDRLTGEITDRTEPDISALTENTSSHALTDTSEGFDVAEAAFPLGRDKITSRKVSKKQDAWTYTLGSVYGDFIYTIDPATGTITEKTEPDIEEVRNQEGFQEPLSMDEVMAIAVKESGLSPALISNRNVAHGEDNNWRITLETQQGNYTYFIDGFTGEITDSIIPEGDGGELPEDPDPFGSAISASYAAMENFDYKAENIKVAQKQIDGKDVIVVNFDWQGNAYEFFYSLADRQLIKAD